MKIRLRSPYEGRRNYQGILRGVEEQDVVVLVDDHEYLLPIDSIDKANIIPVLIETRIRGSNGLKGEAYNEQRSTAGC